MVHLSAVHHCRLCTGGWISTFLGIKSRVYSQEAPHSKGIMGITRLEFRVVGGIQKILWLRSSLATRPFAQGGGRVWARVYTQVVLTECNYVW